MCKTINEKKTSIKQQRKSTEWHAPDIWQAHTECDSVALVCWWEIFILYEFSFGIAYGRK